MSKFEEITSEGKIQELLQASPPLGVGIQLLATFFYPIVWWNIISPPFF
jgi:hypothetical protein